MNVKVSKPSDLSVKNTTPSFKNVFGQNPEPNGCGYLVFTSHEITLYPGMHGVINTGVILKKNDAWLINAKSVFDTATRYGIYCMECFVNADGYIIVSMANLSETPFGIVPGDAVAELIFYTKESIGINIRKK